MTLEKELRTRSGDVCELCSGTGDLVVQPVPPDANDDADRSVILCPECAGQVTGAAPVDPDHWRSLPDVMWSSTPAVQVMAWRMLRRLRTHAWAAEALEMLYLDDATRSWAEAAEIEEATDGSVVHRDANGAVLQAGDTVTLVKDLNVKGAGFTAKRGTAVRGITLVRDNPAHIEGRVNGQQIVILTEFVKKSG